MKWTERILDFPVRTAAVDDFLRDLRAHGQGDLNAVLATLNEGGLCREAVEYWTGNGWITLAPSQPTIALAGSAFFPQLGLRAFCGEVAEKEAGSEPDSATRIENEEESQDDEHP